MATLNSTSRKLLKQYNNEHPNDRLKFCACCKSYLPATKEFFISSHRYKDGFAFGCRKCSLDRTRERRKTKRGKLVDAVFKSNRRAKNSGIAGTLVYEDVLAVFEFFDWKCVYCGVDYPNATITIEHLLPYSKGGLNCSDNIVPACYECNTIRRSKELDVWVKWLQRFGFDAKLFYKRLAELKTKLP